MNLPRFADRFARLGHIASFQNACYASEARRAPSISSGRREVRNVHRPQLCISAIAIAVCGLVAAAAVAASANAAEQFTTAVLYDECSNYPASSVQKAHCNGFVHGFLVGALTGWEIAGKAGPLPGPPSLFCGGNPSVSQLVTLFQIFVRAHPETLDLEAAVALVAALVVKIKRKIPR